MTCRVAVTIVVFVVLTFTASQSFSQTRKIDSLRTVIVQLERRSASFANDTAIVNKTNVLAALYESVNADSMIVIASRNILMSEKIKYDVGEAYAQRNAARGYVSKRDGENAESHFNKSLEIFKRLGNAKEQASCLAELASLYKNTGDFENAIGKHLESKKIREQLKDKKGVAANCYQLGAIYLMKPDFENALYYFREDLRLSEELNEISTQAYAHNGIGATLMAKGDIDKALDEYFQALKVFEKTNELKGMSAVYVNIGNILADKKDFTKAIEYIQLSMKTKGELGDKIGLYTTMLTLGNVYVRSGDLDKGLEYFLVCKKVGLESGNKRFLGSVYNSLAGAYFLGGNADSAIVYIVKSIEFQEAVGDKESLVNSHANLCNLYRKKRLFDDAKKHCDRAVALSEEMNTKSKRLPAYQSSAALDSALGNWSGAYQNMRLYQLYYDSIYNEQSSQQMTEMQTKYETEKKEQAIELLTKENKLKAAEANMKDLQIRDRMNEISLLDRDTKIKDLKLSEKQNELERKNLYATKKDNEVQLLNKDKALQSQEINRQKLMRNSFIGGFAVMLIFAGVFFLQRNRISKEQHRSEALLLNILPAEVADELKTKGYADAKQFDNVTVLFTDFKDFTKCSERMTPKELVSELHECFKGFDEIISRHNVEKIKTVGDAYLAVSGLPVANKNHATDIVKAAIGIRDFMLQRHTQLQDKTFRVRIGVHSGNVIAGIVGVKKYAYDIWGDTVNIAARMEQHGEPGRVNISQSTYDLVRNNFNCEHRGKVDAKNKGEMDMYFVLAATNERSTYAHKNDLVRSES